MTAAKAAKPTRPISTGSRNSAPPRPIIPVGAEYWVSSRDLRVLVEEATEPVLSGDLDVGVDWIG